MSFFSNRRQADEEDESVEGNSPMPRLAAAPQPVGFETVLGANCVIEGSLRSRANVRLDGAFTGTLEIEGNVLVGETAKINADIDAKNVSIAGAVRGNVSGKKVQLLRTGRIWGDIQATALTTEEGAFIDGKITMVGHDANAPVVEEPGFVTEAIEAADVPAEPEIEPPVVEESNEGDGPDDPVTDSAHDDL